MPSYLHNRLGKLERKIAPLKSPRKFVKIIAEGTDEEEVFAETEAEGFSRDQVEIIWLVAGKADDGRVDSTDSGRA
jgi:hypothetical protein